MNKKQKKVFIRIIIAFALIIILKWIPIEGYVCTTSDKMAVEAERLEGIRQEIPFYFKGKLATADSRFEGDIVLITNGGEYTIPYSVKVIHKYIETS